MSQTNSKLQTLKFCSTVQKYVVQPFILGDKTDCLDKMKSSLISNEIKKVREERATIIGQTRVSCWTLLILVYMRENMS